MLTETGRFNAPVYMTTEPKRLAAGQIYSISKNTLSLIFCFFGSARVIKPVNKCVTHRNSGMNFQHYTSMDTTRDFKFNAVKRIRKTAKDKDVKVIVNGKVVDKEKDIREGMFVFPLNFKKLSNPTITVKQAKAIKDKTKGLSLCGYNKNKEIESVSHKDYIKDFYGNPKSLHRLEVHQNNEEIKDFCKRNKIVQDINLIFNQDFLDAMYEAHLSSLLRFTKGRTKIEWKEILH